MDRKYQTLIAKDYKNNIVLKRFRQILIDEIIPIYSVEEMEDFIAFCQFDFSFLLNASDYELIAAVQKKYAAYLEMKIPTSRRDSLN